MGLRWRSPAFKGKGVFEMNSNAGINWNRGKKESGLQGFSTAPQKSDEYLIWIFSCQA